MIENFTPANPIVHDFIQTILIQYPNPCFNETKKHLGVNYVKKSRMLNERYIIESRKEEPVFYKPNPFQDCKMDVVWLLNQKETSYGAPVDWHCIYHEIKTGSINVKEICNKYLGKHSKSYKNVGSTDSPLWIWGYEKQIYNARKYVNDSYILGKIKNSSIRFVPIEWIMPIMQNAYSNSGIGILGGEI